MGYCRCWCSHYRFIGVGINQIAAIGDICWPRAFWYHLFHGRILANVESTIDLSEFLYFLLRGTVWFREF